MQSMIDIINADLLQQLIKFLIKSLIDMQLTSKFNKDFECLLWIIDIYSKYACVVPLKDEKDITITDALQIFLDESNRKLINTWVDKGSGFFNRSMKLWSEFNDIEIYTVIIEESLL